MAEFVVLIGAEYEENLSLRYLAATVQAAGFQATILPFNHAGDAASVVESALAAAPLVIGISIPFQVRAPEFLDLASRLRSAGSTAHVCVGGHFATFEYETILREHPAIDSVVRHEGEEPFLELCRRLRDGLGVPAFPGIVIRGETGVVVGPPHRLPPLDELPFPDRRGEPHNVVGVPCAPLVGSRGCYADCSFCCIYAYSENANAPRYRRRSLESLICEMREQYETRGVRLFVFHDDNFFLPHAATNLNRYQRLAELLRAAGLTDIALVIKCRPNDVDPALFALLKSMGMIRAYIGIETNSDEGIVSLNRRITSEDNERALGILEDLDIYCSFNVLIFDPEATLDGIRRNLDFMERHSDRPFNFCRAEVYAGTPLKEILTSQNRLRGDYLAWDYTMRQPRVELLFRIATTAFHGRNFKSDGVHNLNMGIRFDNEVLRRFYPRASDAGWHAGLVDLSREIGQDSVGRMRRILAFVEGVDQSDAAAIKRFALEMTRETARADLRFIGRIKTARRELEARIARVSSNAIGKPNPEGMPVWAAETARLATSTGREFSAELLPSPATRRNLP